MIGRLGLPELMLVFAIAILVFGPRQVPKLGKMLGESIKEFRRAGQELTKGWDDGDGDGGTRK